MCPGQIPSPERGVGSHGHALGNVIDKALPKMEVVERASCLWSLLRRPYLSSLCQSMMVLDVCG